MTTLPKCYQELTSEPVQWLTQTYGDASVIGFRGTENAINKCYNLFANYDPRPMTPRGYAPDAPQLTFLFPTLAYMYMPAERLEDTLTFYFHVMISRELGQLNQPLTPHVEFPTIAFDPVEESDIEYATKALDHWEREAKDWAAIEADNLDDQVWQIDEKTVAKLAKQAARTFIAEHIVVKTFMPEPPQTILAEHVLGRDHHTEVFGTEDLATVTSNV